MTATNEPEYKEDANAVSVGSTDLICSRCGSKGAITYRQNTAYHNDALNWATLCPPCKDENDRYWRDQWDEYYTNCM